MTALCFLDTETTGVHPEREVWEVGMIRRDDQGEREIQFFVDVDLSKADPFGLSVGRFYERHPTGRYLAGQRESDPGLGMDVNLWSAYSANREVARWTHGAHIVGAVPNFDTEVLGKILRAHGLIPAWHYRLIDIENLAVGYISGRWGLLDEAERQAVQLPWDSDKLTAALGLEPVPDDERHTALGDARWAMRMYDRVMNPP